MTYYFTFGTLETFPFRGGWVEVEADCWMQACLIFRAYYPDRSKGLLNCAGSYTAEEFASTSMAKEGNFGAFCHRKLP